MKKVILVTGAGGFIGKHLVEALSRREELDVRPYDLGNTPEELDAALREADVIYHLAGVNRPKDVAEFQTGNAGFTEELLARLRQLGRAPLFVLSSSIQAELDNPYGQSKREAEAAVRRYALENDAPVFIFRLTNVFGKWCRPNYNSVVATFCHNIANDLPISISDPAHEIRLVYIDDVVRAFLTALDAQPPKGNCQSREAAPTYPITLGALAEQIRAFRALRTELVLPDFSDRFTRCLYATYLSYLKGEEFGYALAQHTDPRGALAEFLKSPQFGQIFVSRTKPGITRGNHYHHTKTEKFLVLQGEASIRFRHIHSEAVIEHRVSGTDFRVLDIPPGYTHAIENVGDTEMVVLFWASEPFNPNEPDTYYAPVLK